MKGKKKEVSVIDTIVEGMQEKKGKDITVIDLSGIDGVLFDYFVICHADSNRHVEAVSDSVAEFTHKRLDLKPHHVEGTENAQWILMDYMDVVVHIFQKQYREFYDLEGLWADGKMKRIENL